MTNEKRQDGCAEWCGLPYKDDRVPYNPNLQGQRADGSSLPWGISDRDGAEQTDPAYCTAACLERAQEKPVKRERPTTPEGWAALLPTQEPPDTGPKKLRPGQVYAHGYKSMGYMIGEVGPRTTGPKRWVNGMLVNPEGYSFKRLAGNYTDALTFVTNECFVSRRFVLLFDAPDATEPVKREPVAPWTRSPGRQNCTTGFNWTTRQWDDESHYRGSHAMYTRPAPDGGTGNVAVCEACAERAGVFGPVSIAAPKPDAPVYPKPQENPFPGGTPAWPPVPTCAGPLATHGTPVLRWVGSQYTRTTILLCDGCYLHHEQNVRECMDQDDSPEFKLLPVNHAEPPARIGTVPQVVSVGVGIWASRGMRWVRP